MDEFAQTRGADDLFDDDFTPVTESEQQTYQPAVEFLQSQDSPPQFLPNEQIPQGPRNGPRAIPTHTPHRSSQAPPTQSQPPTTTITPTSNKNDNSITAAPPTPPRDPSAPHPPRPTAAVRGDRLATGGTLKPKLTEEELSAKLAAAKINSEKRAEAHRLAEADEASFQQREAKATERRREEGKARRMMDMEREKNRLRKLEAGKKGGREWDEGKEEEEERAERGRGGGGRYRRGAHGGIAGGGHHVAAGDRYSGAPQAGEEEEEEAGQSIPIQGGCFGGGYGGRSRGRGRCDGGGRGRGGRGRGGDAYMANASSNRPPEQKAPDPTLDFPALPPGPKSREGGGETLPSNRGGENVQSPVMNGASWADQVNEKES